MHFEILVEDQSGKKFIESTFEKILYNCEIEYTYNIHSYKGAGHIPKSMKSTTDPRKRILLDRLPSLLRGYGKCFNNFSHVVVVVVDLDDKNCAEFKQELINIAKQCNPPPNVLFRIAIEEMEAWLLGDLDAVRHAYPNAKKCNIESVYSG